MITPAYLIEMAAYNRWQNESLYAAAERIGDAARRAERGAFFGSIHATLDHILWADQLWLSRFSGSEPPRAQSIAESVAQHEDWPMLVREREAFDDVIDSWARGVDPAWLAESTTWLSGSLGREVTQPNWLLATHLFNHQTHHRGQVHAMLTAAGERPADTDLPFRPSP